MKKMMNTLKIFNEIQSLKADFIMQNSHAKLSGLNSPEIKNLAVAWCYYSGKIEGNTYTYVETDALLNDNITSPKQYEDAKMLKNLYNAFITSIETIKLKGENIPITATTVFSIHSILTNDLIQTTERGRLRERAVAITGTKYIPPKELDEINRKFIGILEKQNEFKNPFERAIYLHCNIARLQPFIDGNKRTSRLIEGIVMMHNDIIPVYSTKDEDLLTYKKSLVHFYETSNYNPYVDYFLNRQINRINELSTSKDKTFDLSLNKIIEPKNKKNDFGLGL